MKKRKQLSKANPPTRASKAVADKPRAGRRRKVAANVSGHEPRRVKVQSVIANVFDEKPRRVELQSVDTFFELRDGQPTLRHKRRFTNTSSDRLLFFLLGLRFYGPGGLMVTSTADAEECDSDGTFRLVKNFKPMQNTPSAFLSGSFNVSQKLLECSLGPLGVTALMQMSFTPIDPDSPGPRGSLLWALEPGRTETRESCAYWTDLVNTEETQSRGFTLRVKPGSAEILMALHNRLIGGAGQRVVQVLNASSYESGVVFAAYVKSGRLDFLSKKMRTRKR
jgi:hypothetical protein